MIRSHSVGSITAVFYACVCIALSETQFRWTSQKTLRLGLGAQGSHSAGGTVADVAAHLREGGRRSHRARRQTGLEPVQVKIIVNYLFDPSPTELAAFDDAATTWESLIPELADGAGHGAQHTSGGEWRITIDADIRAIDGPSQTLGFAGPQAGWYLYGTSGLRYPVVTTGTMVFDSADTSTLENEGVFADVILHEMGHCLSIGTWWPLLPIPPIDNGYTYAAAHASSAYCREVGNAGSFCDGIYSIPIERGGGAGTELGHWDEPDNGNAPDNRSVVREGHTLNLRNEALTGWLNAPLFLSAFTCKALQDSGFQCVACVDQSDCLDGSICTPQEGCSPTNSSTCWLPNTCVFSGPPDPTQTSTPTATPVASPTHVPSVDPTSSSPTSAPSLVPISFSPTRSPSASPTRVPVGTPTHYPTLDATTQGPASQPTNAPTAVPSMCRPVDVDPGATCEVVCYDSADAFDATSGPRPLYNGFPTRSPTTLTARPACDGHDAAGCLLVSSQTESLICSQLAGACPQLCHLCVPSASPSSLSPVTATPSGEPTLNPAVSPSVKPTFGPTQLPSAVPTHGPSREPTSLAPTTNPTSKSPTASPTSFPSAIPVVPTAAPTRAPSGPAARCCVGNEATYFSPFGGCETYAAGGPNHPFCAVDGHQNSGRLPGCTGGAFGTEGGRCTDPNAGLYACSVCRECAGTSCLGTPVDLNCDPSCDSETARQRRDDNITLSPTSTPTGSPTLCRPVSVGPDAHCAVLCYADPFAFGDVTGPEPLFSGFSTRSPTGPTPQPLCSSPPPPGCVGISPETESLLCSQSPDSCGSLCGLCVEADSPPPTDEPTPLPTTSPTSSPVTKPTEHPVTQQPSMLPTLHPTLTLLTLSPTLMPSAQPTSAPTGLPSTPPPTQVPFVAPTSVPTMLPTTSPVTQSPTTAPSLSPVTNEPTAGPTNTLTSPPQTGSPTLSPTSTPVSTAPTALPTTQPTQFPTAAPAVTPETACCRGIEQTFITAYGRCSTYAAGGANHAFCKSDSHQNNGAHPGCTNGVIGTEGGQCTDPNSGLLACSVCTGCFGVACPQQAVDPTCDSSCTVSTRARRGLAAESLGNTQGRQVTLKVTMSRAAVVLILAMGLALGVALIWGISQRTTTVYA
eukprot:m.469880 g.469880  ORF g.469880 m.469880 type:complete len:1136 (+) comp29188_c0_seq1:433-3840(+)